MANQSESILSVPTPEVLRSRLVELTLKDLLGPRGGEFEEIDESGRLTDLYILGTIAPRNRRSTADPTPPDLDPSSDRGGVDLTADELEVEGQDAGLAEDSQADATNPPGDSLFPSAIGLSFTVDQSVQELKVTAGWGRYQRGKSESILTEKGNPKTVWQREPVQASQILPLQAGAIADWQVDPRFAVFVRGQIRILPISGDWIVSLFLVNEQSEPIEGQGARDEAWLFQPLLRVRGGDPAASPFIARDLKSAASQTSLSFEDQHMGLLYRNHCEFAVGHGVGVQVTIDPKQPQRAQQIETAIVPRHEVPNVSFEPRSEVTELAGLMLDMQTLSEAPIADIIENLSALPRAYQSWINERELQLQTDVTVTENANQQAIGKTALAQCSLTCQRLAEGLKVLAEDAIAQQAFQFMNQAMRLQRLSGLFSREQRRGGNRTLADFENDPKLRPRWRLFQLAFILVNLPSLIDPTHRDRSGENGLEGLADLLFFPTGGGKTEAYLGLTALTLALRRLRPNLGDLDAGRGVAVLMRYTLRLLTLQQFQRATTLICACEVLRRQDPDRWGQESFRIGLWVGMKTTPNTTAQAEEAIKTTGYEREQFRAAAGTPQQLTYCPWCGSGVSVKVESLQKGRGRTRLVCDHPLGNCAFSDARSGGDGLPVMVVDEEIYRRPPSLLIATVDKFAQMPWQGAIQNLFGYVQKECPRHGFFSAELEDSHSHPAAGKLPAVKAIVPQRLRPPDLIIQDELHLISGPLGSMVGLYETAIDTLCSWELGDRLIRPKIIASTATVRQAKEQVHRLFNRRLAVFPPQALDIEDNFFARQLPTQPQSDPAAEWKPGRLYLGICSPGRRLKSTLIRVYTTLLAASQQLYEDYPSSSDAWMTLVGYFNALRDLGSTYRLVDDEVRTRLSRQSQRGLADRSLRVIEELTSRKQADDIPKILDKLELRFPSEPMAKLKKGHQKTPLPVDVLLATNMISVGVDVDRLGLMVVTGQPKNTAEYIQATSRVGRSQPGLVVTLYNWARPRDLSHYETFGHYHDTFYQQVEALSLTPFSAGSISRGLAGVLTSLVRLNGSDFNDNAGAGQVQRQSAILQAACQAIEARATQQNGEGVNLADLQQQLASKVDSWMHRTQQGAGIALGYRPKKAPKTGENQAVGLLKSFEEAPKDGFATLNSLRNVEPTVGLVLAEGFSGAGPDYEPYREREEG